MSVRRVSLTLPVFAFLLAANAYGQHKYPITAWTTGMTIDTLERRLRKSQPWRDLKRPPGEYPLLELGTSAGLADWYFDYLKHPAYDDYWKQVSVHEHFAQIQVPALHIGGWYATGIPTPATARRAPQSRSRPRT